MITAVPVRADDRVIIDYNDYITDVVYGDNKSTVTVSGVPLDKSLWRLYSSGWTTLATIDGDSGLFDYTLSSSSSYILNWSPFGADNYYWDLTYIPTGTQIELVFDVQIYADDPLSVYVVSQEEGYSLAYYDEDFNVVGNTSAYPDDVTVDEYYHINMTVNPPDGAKYMRFGMMVDKFKLSADSKIRVVGWGLSMIFDVDSLVYLQQVTGKTTALLQYIISGDDSWNNAADDFNNSVDEITPGVSDDMDKLDEVTQPDISDIGMDMDDLVEPDGISTASDILSILVGYQFVGWQFITVVTIMLLGYVLHGKRG